MFHYIDPLYYLMMAPVLLISIVFSIRVKSAFNKYSKIRNSSGMTGAQVAEAMLSRNGLGNIQVKEAKGFLSDHYDPTKKVIKLSPKVYSSNSIAAVGIAAHETGHAIQHKDSYAPLTLRNMMVPLASFGSNMSYIIIIMGFIMNAIGLIKIGVILFAAVVVFQIITLPVEFNASKRAKVMLYE